MKSVAQYILKSLCVNGNMGKIEEICTLLTERA